MTDPEFKYVVVVWVLMALLVMVLGGLLTKIVPFASGADGSGIQKVLTLPVLAK